MRTSRSSGDDADLPQKILDAFTERSELSLKALARAMEPDIKTLQRHREAGELPVHIKGTGVTRRHYVCTLADVATFYSVREYPMSVFRVKKSPFWQFDFQIRGYRFYGSTKERNERAAQECEKAKGPKPSALSPKPSQPEGSR